MEATLTITNSGNIKRRVLKGEIDLDFAGAQTVQPGLQVRSLADDEIVLIAPPAHPLARRRSFAPDLLAQETLVTREPGSDTRQVVETHLALLDFKPARMLEMAGREAVKRVAGAGLGVTFVSRLAITLEVAHRLVVEVAIPELHFPLQLYLLSRKKTHPPAAALMLSAMVMKYRSETG